MPPVIVGGIRYNLKTTLGQGRLKGESCAPNRKVAGEDLRTLAAQRRPRGQRCQPTIAEFRNRIRLIRKARKSRNIGVVRDEENDDEDEMDLRDMMDEDTDSFIREAQEFLEGEDDFDAEATESDVDTDEFIREAEAVLRDEQEQEDEDEKMSEEIRGPEFDFVILDDDDQEIQDEIDRRRERVNDLDRDRILVDEDEKEIDIDEIDEIRRSDVVPEPGERGLTDEDREVARARRTAKDIMDLFNSKTLTQLRLWKSVANRERVGGDDLFEFFGLDDDEDSIQDADKERIIELMDFAIGLSLNEVEDEEFRDILFVEVKDIREGFDAIGDAGLIEGERDVELTPEPQGEPGEADDSEIIRHQVLEPGFRLRTGPLRPDKRGTPPPPSPSPPPPDVKPFIIEEDVKRRGKDKKKRKKKDVPKAQVNRLRIFRNRSFRLELFSLFSRLGQANFIAFLRGEGIEVDESDIRKKSIKKGTMDKIRNHIIAETDGLEGLSPKEAKKLLGNRIREMVGLKGG